MDKIFYCWIFLFVQSLALASDVDPGGSEPCELDFIEQTTTINGVDTSEWISIGSSAVASKTTGDPNPSGLDCDLLVAVSSPAQAGDFAYVTNDFNITGTPNNLNGVEYNFGLDMTNLVKSFDDGSKVSMFQVRSNHPNESRLLNVVLSRTDLSIAGSKGISIKWQMKVVWFKPLYIPVDGKYFVKDVTYVSLIAHEDRVIPFKYIWNTNGSRLEIDGVMHENPYGYIPYADPQYNRLGYIYSNTLLEKGDEMFFPSLFANSY